MLDQKYYDLVKKYYCDDEDLAWQWFITKNEAFNMLTPIELLRLGGHLKVKYHIVRKMGDVK